MTAKNSDFLGGAGTFGGPKGAALQGQTAAGERTAPYARAASRKLTAARDELEERRMALQTTAVDRIHRLALVGPLLLPTQVQVNPPETCMQTPLLSNP